MFRSESSASIEVEASSFSVWNCVITFLQILLISTVLYGAGWSQGQMYNFAPETLVRFQHFRAVAFFFCVWAIQSLALALLLVWAIGKKNYSLCHTWLLSEALMQVFIVVSLSYFAYQSLHEDQQQSNNTTTAPDLNEGYSTSTHSIDHYETSFRPPKHLAFLVVLHFLVKGFGFWIVRRYMKVLKKNRVHVITNDAEASGTAVDAHGITTDALESSSNRQTHRQRSPPPSYAFLCKDDLPCYDEALRLSLNKEQDNHVNQIK